MANTPITLVIGDVDRQAEPYLRLARETTLLFASNADDVIELTSDNEPIGVCLVSAADPQHARDLCLWLKTDDEVRQLPLVVVGMGDTDAQQWLDAGAHDYIDIGDNPAVVASRVKSLVELKHKTDLLAKIASLDGLTSLPDHRRLDEYLDIEWRRSLREYYPLSLIKLDLDGFAAFNEHYGLGRGDDALRRIAHALEKHFNRAADMLSRYHRDEFVALLPSLELESALLLAEKMVATVRELAIEHELSDSGVLTASAGVAMIEPSRDNRAQDLLDEAAEILSRAQQMGGNQAQGIAI